MAWRVVFVLPLLLLAILVAACEETDEMMPDEMPESEGMLGGGAETNLLAEGALSAPPDDGVRWIAHELDSEGADITHAHAPGFVFVRQGMHTVAVSGEEHRLMSGEGRFIEAGAEHRHAPDGMVWHIVIEEDPGSVEGVTGELVFESGPLEGIPSLPMDVRMILVELPMGMETSVHTHPGPEYIHVLDGRIEYQNELIGTVQAEAGDDHAIPPGTAVQKRNKDGSPASFLSLFIVATDEQFAPDATFDD